MDPLQAGMSLVERHGSEQDRPDEFDLCGRTWTLLPGVFAPVYTASTKLFTEALPFPLGGRFLEVGCGTGVTAVTAALAGCAAAVAVDISSAAVRNAAANAARHGVAERVTVLLGDVFDGLEDEEDFDVIYWNTVVLDAEVRPDGPDDLRHSFFDFGYEANRRYLREAPGHLRPGGRLFLGFNSLGNRPLLDEIAASAGLRAVTAAEFPGQVGGIPVSMYLLEFVPLGS